jgi:hypothetical protein
VMRPRGKGLTPKTRCMMSVADEISTW